MIKKEQTDKYKAYIQSKEWYDIKLDIIHNRGSKCEACGTPKPAQGLQLHHLTYKRLYNELPEDLQLLCKGCHLTAHNIKNGRKKKAKVANNKKRSKKEKMYSGLRNTLKGRDRKLQDRYDKLKR